jgi:carboxymethylenebutenolidase
LAKAEKYAKEGYMTIVPDLYRGKVADHDEEANHLMNGLDWAGAIQDIQGACDYLHSKGCKHVGITGFCMGGALSLLSALNVTGLSCCVFFYGIPGADLSGIKIPIQGHFGNKDNHKGFSDPDSVNALEDKMKNANVNLDLHRYDDAEHAFSNQEGTHIKRYHPESAKLATHRQLAFFAKHLK